MKKILQKSLLGITLLFTGISQADSLPNSINNNFVGIWQDQASALHYYSAQYSANANTFILVDLSSIEATHDTLLSSYSGILANLEEGVMSNTRNVVTLGNLSSFKNKEIKVQVKLYVDLTGTLTPICGPNASCAGNIINIKKVF